MVYLYPIGMSPSKLAIHLNDLTNMVQLDYDFASIVALGANIQSEQQNILLRLMSDFIVERNGN
jgi:hypothetical protein